MASKSPAKTLGIIAAEISDRSSPTARLGLKMKVIAADRS